MVDESRSEPPKIKVVDRRKFSSEGDLLETSSPAAEPSAAETSAPTIETPSEVRAQQEPTQRTSGRPSAPFLELVAMLAEQAELLLVGTEEVPAQPAAAQRVINYLGVLEEKTKGNLSAEESNVLSSILYQLRTLFLQRK